MAARPLILVTAAAGRTGRETVRSLLQRGYPVRALVRRSDERAKALERLGADVVVGNLFDFRDVQRAMRGVARALHCPPFAPNLLHNTMLVCLAAQEARLEALVLLSGWNPSPDHPSALTREHWIANNVARWMPDVGVIHLNPGIFAYTYHLTLPITRRLGILPLPFGRGQNAPVSERDIGRCAAALLDRPATYVGTSWRPTGPQLLDGDDVARILSRVLERPVRYQPTSITMFAKAARAQGFADFDTFNVRHYAEEVAQGAFAVGAPTDHVARLTGDPAEPFEQTARRYAADVSLVAPNLREVSYLGALAFLLRTMLTPAPDFAAMSDREGIAPLRQHRLAHENEDWQRHARSERLMLLERSASAAEADRSMSGDVGLPQGMELRRKAPV